MDRPLGVILAGGQATRMGGGDKPLRHLGGVPMLTRVIERLSPQVGAVVLNANGDPGRFDAFGLPVIADSIDGFAGPLAGILAGLDYAASVGADAIVTVAADTPAFPDDLVLGLRTAAAERGEPLALAATPRPGGGVYRHPTFGYFETRLRGDLRAALTDGVRKVVLWTDRHGRALHHWPEGGPLGDPFFNVNTPEDLVRAETAITGAAPEEGSTR